MQQVFKLAQVLFVAGRKQGCLYLQAWLIGAFEMTSPWLEQL